jgi:hypothetical protein
LWEQGGWHGESIATLSSLTLPSSPHPWQPLIGIDNGLLNLNEDDAITKQRVEKGRYLDFILNILHICPHSIQDNIFL